MSSHTATHSPTPDGLLGIFKSWGQVWSGEFGDSPDEHPAEISRFKAHSYGSVLVLVVDDNPLNLMVISTLMEARGLVPFLATDGAEAVALACELHFDLILMDLQMPILDGLRATSAIRSFERNLSRPAVPVVAYSNTAPGEGVMAMHGLNGSLSKPCEDLDLEECLVRWCPSYRPAPALPDIGFGNSAWQTANCGPSPPVAPHCADTSHDGPGPGRSGTAADIAAEDWDMLFRAALELLSRVATEKPTLDSTGVRLQPPGTVLRECVQALDQLRRSVPSAQHRTIRNARARGVDADSSLPPKPRRTSIADD